MNELTNERTNKRTDERTKEYWMHEWMNEPRTRLVDKWIEINALIGSWMFVLVNFLNIWIWWIYSEWMDGWMDGWMDVHMYVWMDGWMNEWMDGWMDGGRDGWMDGWMDYMSVIWGLMDEWMAGQIMFK